MVYSLIHGMNTVISGMNGPDKSGASFICKSRCNVQLPGDDFFCLRYKVWYSSWDCAVRTRFRTAPGCLNCDQGRFNHHRHRDTVKNLRFRFGAESGES